MSQYIVLSHIDIQNANSIAGLTWGFPAITHFLGFTHALNRKLSNHYSGEYGTELTGCAVISHTVENKVCQPEKNADFKFIQSRNPPVLRRHKKKDPPIIEEGKMNLTVSIVIELGKSLSLTTAEIKNLQEELLVICCSMRLAGGTVIGIKQAKFLSASTQEQQADMLRKIKRLTLPGFVLLDRSDYLKEHYLTMLANHTAKKLPQNKPQLLDAWLDFSALKSKASPQLIQGQTVPDASTLASWEHVSKPYSGYLVPLMTGYKAISEVYDAGVVLNTRDEITPSCFAEAIHSVGEWKGVHSLKAVETAIWRYEQDGQWYLCKQSGGVTADSAPEEKKLEAGKTQTFNFNDALNLF